MGTTRDWTAADGRTITAELVRMDENEIKDSVHNNIHWQLAKDPEVFKWHFVQTKKK